MGTCLFCEIIQGNVPCDVIYEDDHCLAFRDIAPQAPTHLLLIPKSHIASLNDIETEQRALAGHLLHQANQLAKQEKLTTNGYRVVVNCGQDGGQTVGHLHLHILGGRAMQWPPG